MSIAKIRTLFSNTSGNVVILAAAGFGVLGAVGAFSVDMASFYVTKRTLQGVADAAALAAAADPQNATVAAVEAVRSNGQSPQIMTALDMGTYTGDASIAPATRFAITSAADGQNAARVRVTGQANSLFASLLGGSGTIPIAAKAVATRINLASFSVGSRIAAEQGGIVNSVLSGMAGTELGLSIADENRLASTKIDLLQFIAALRSSYNVDAVTFNDILQTNITLPQAVSALARATSDPITSSRLQMLAGLMPTTAVPLSSLIDLGPIGTQTKPSSQPIQVGLLDLFRAILEVGGTHQVSSTLSPALPGILNSQVTVQIGQRSAHSPWLAVAADRRVTVHTAQTRILIETTAMGSLPTGPSAIKIPLYVEIGEATATLAGLSCGSGRVPVSASLDVTPSIGTLALASVNREDMRNFGAAVPMTPATLVSTPIISVTGFGAVSLSDNQAQRVTFNQDDIRLSTVKTVTAGGTPSSLVQSLVQKTNIKANVLGGLLSSQLVTAAVLSNLTLNTSSLDLLMATVSSATGVRLGQADSWIDGVRCGAPTIVG